MADAKNNGKPGKGGLEWFLGALFLFAGAAYFRSMGSNLFYSLATFLHSAKTLSYDFPPGYAPLFTRLGELFRVYLNNSFFPAFLLFLPAVIMAAVGLERSFGKERKWLSFLDNPCGERRFLAALFLLGFLVCLGVNFFVLGGNLFFVDEFSYLFQSRALLKGKLYVESPPLPRHFQYAHIINDGKWYSKFTIGWPLLLAPAEAVKIPFVVNPLLAAGSLVLLYLVTREFFDRRAAVLAAFLALFSPYFFLMGASLFPHTASGFCMLLVVYCLQKLLKPESGKYSLIYSIAGGAAMGLLPLIRPADGVVFTAGILPPALYLIWKTPDRRKSLAGIIPVILGLAVGGGILLLCNRVQNGNPFLLGFIKYRPDERMGFGIFGHTPLKGLYNFLYLSMRMAFWVVPLSSLGILFALWKKKMPASLLLIPPVFFLLFHFFYYSLGDQEFGARYYYPVFILLLPLSAGGFSLLPEILGKTERFPSGSFIPAYMALGMIFMASAVYPRILPPIAGQFASHKEVMSLVKNPPGMKGKSLTFIRNCPGMIVNFYTRNGNPDYQDDPNLLAIFLTPEDNRELVEKFPDRTPGVLYFDNRQNRFVQMPYNRDVQPQVADYLDAAVNYKLSVPDNRRAEQAYFQALKLSGNHPSILFSLGFFYFDTGQYEKALPVFRELTGLEDEFPEALYYKGRCLGEMGRYKEAVETLRIFVEKYPATPDTGKAENWVKYYMKKS